MINPNGRIEYSNEQVVGEVLEAVFISTYEGQLAYIPIVPGSVAISYEKNKEVYLISDDGNGKFNTSELNEEGNIDYKTGKYYLSFKYFVDDPNASYMYDVKEAEVLSWKELFETK